ncbi:MAG TPA: trigger factor [Solirubrobacteraceae bacterium]|nr:trigger factor [Solirubrobacteraceae bacterium]
MSAAPETTVAELPDSRVRVEVSVAPVEVKARLEGKARELGRELKLPGFRRGKVPAPLVIQRIGRDAVLDQAVRDSLGRWYAQALEQSGIVPVGDPKLDVDFENLPDDGQPLQFSIEVGVVPKATLGDYTGLEVPRREPLVDEEQVEQEIQALRERLAKLETAERAATQGDFVVIDYLGSLPAEDDPERLEPFEGGEGRDQLIELGAGNLIPGFEEALVGMSAGEQNDVRLTFPADYPAEHLAGKEASFAVTVKEVKAKELPPLDDDLAIDAGFDDLGELREDIRTRMLENDEARVAGEFRQAALDAVVATATVPVTDELAEGRAREMWDSRLHSLAHQGISREAFLQITGREEADLLAELKDEAERTLRREAVLSAIVQAEQLEPDEERLLEAIAPTAEREGVEAEKLLQELRSRGREEELRESVAARMAEELIAERSKPITPEQAQAREALWTPDQETEAEGAAAGSGAGKLWTPTERSSAG